MTTDNCREREDWGAWVCAETYVSLSVNTEGERDNITVSGNGAAHTMYGVGGSPADRFTTNLIPEQTYALDVEGGTPGRFTVTLQEGQGRSVKRFGQTLEASASLGALDSAEESGYFYSGGTLHLKLVSEDAFLQLSVE